MKILFTGGGTGGHVFPLVAIAREIRTIHANKNLEFCYAGPKDEFASILLSQEDFVVKNIVSGKVRRYFDWRNFVDILFKIPIGFLQSFFVLLFLRPALIFSKGGSGSIVITAAAWFLRIPVFIHESDVTPGLSNQKTAKWAQKIFTSFAKTEYFDPKKTILTGNPVRKEILGGDKIKAGELFNLTFSKPVILIMGGSQGAEAINDFILQSINPLLKEYELIHVAGRQNFRAIQAESQVVMEKDLDKYYHLTGFLDEEKIKHAYAASDLIISRAGASAIFEIAAVGKPSILIPLPASAGNHQAKNAYAYAETGAAEVVEQENLKQNFLLEKIRLLLLQPEKLKEMSQAALTFAKPLAARAVAREILEFLMID